jgi:hypothetical protein
MDNNACVHMYVCMDRERQIAVNNKVQAFQHLPNSVRNVVAFPIQMLTNPEPH